MDIKYSVVLLGAAVAAFTAICGALINRLAKKSELDSKGLESVKSAVFEMEVIYSDYIYRIELMSITVDAFKKAGSKKVFGKDPEEYRMAYLREINSLETSFKSARDKVLLSLEVEKNKVGGGLSDKIKRLIDEFDDSHPLMKREGEGAFEIPQKSVGSAKRKRHEDLANVLGALEKASRDFTGNEVMMLFLFGSFLVGALYMVVYGA